MVPYYILILFPMLIGLFCSVRRMRLGGSLDSGKQNSELVWFFGIFLALLMFRDVTCGVDTERYANLFARMGKLNWIGVLISADREWGYAIFTKLLSYLATEPQVLLMVTALISVVPLMRFYRDEAELPLLTMVLFATVAPFPMYFSGIKQAIAMAFAIPAWRMAKERKLFKFILLILLATQFHQSAFVLLALYPLYHARITPKWLYVVVPMMALVYVYNVPIFNFLAKLLWEDYGVAGSTGATTVLLMLVAFAVYAFVVPDESKLEPDVIALRNVLLMTIVLQCFAPIHALAMRMNYYFLIFVPLLLPKIATRRKQKLSIITMYSVVAMTGFFALYYLIKAHTGSDILEVYPYVPFWK